MNTCKDFFEEQKEQSEVKANIVSKYFFAWANVIISAQKKYRPSHDRIAYIDLFAGPGRYKDGSQSTPLMILEKAIKNEDIRERLVAIFNDKDSNNSKSLAQAINEISNIDKLKYKPQINSEEVGEEIVKMFEDMNLVPTFFFVDPWGYKGLSLRLVNSVLKDWGCDCVFFFNYNRINMGIGNDFVESHMDSLFGKEKTRMLREKLAGIQSNVREFYIVEELCQALKNYGNRYTLPFRFRNNSGNRTSHHLIFVSKDFKGYEIMKSIMCYESSSCSEGFGSFEYNPADFMPSQSLLFSLGSKKDELKEMLLKEYKGKTIKMYDLYCQHNIDKPYVKKNYKDVLQELEKEDLISVPKHRKNTFADDLIVTFK